MPQWEDYESAKDFAQRRSEVGGDGLPLVRSFIKWLDALVSGDDQLDWAFLAWRENSYLDRDEATALVRAYERLAAVSPTVDGEPDAYAVIAHYLARPEFRDVLRARTGAKSAKAAVVREFFARSLVDGAELPPEVKTEAHNLYVWAMQEAQTAQQRALAEKRARLGQLQQEIDALRVELGE